MAENRVPYALMGFRIAPDGKCFAALTPRAGVLDGKKAVEVPCPKGLSRRPAPEQNEWAHEEAIKRSLSS